MAIEQDIDIDGIDREQQLIERETRNLLEAVLEAGDGDVVQGTLAAFDSGRSTFPSPRATARKAVLPARDDDGRVRILEWGELAMDDEIKEIHRARLSQRADTEDATSRFGWSPTTSTRSARETHRPPGARGDA